MSMILTNTKKAKDQKLSIPTEDNNIYNIRRVSKILWLTNRSCRGVDNSTTGSERYLSLSVNVNKNRYKSKRIK